MYSLFPPTDFYHNMLRALKKKKVHLHVYRNNEWTVSFIRDEIHIHIHTFSGEFGGSRKTTSVFMVRTTECERGRLWGSPVKFHVLFCWFPAILCSHFTSISLFVFLSPPLAVLCLSINHPLCLHASTCLCKYPLLCNFLFLSVQRKHHGSILWQLAMFTQGFNSPLPLLLAHPPPPMGLAV